MAVKMPCWSASGQGITVAKDVADYAETRGVSYVNHTFTSNLALSASLQPYAGLESHKICEYPTELKSLAIEPSQRAIAKYLVEVEIRVKGQLLYRSPTINA